MSHSNRIQVYLKDSDFKEVKAFAERKGLKLAEAGRYLIVTSLKNQIKENKRFKDE